MTYCWKEKGSYKMPCIVWSYACKMKKKGTCVCMCVSLCVTAKLNEYDTFDCIGNAMFVLLNMLSLVLSFPALRWSVEQTCQS